MKSISLYVDKDTWSDSNASVYQTVLHIVTAISVSLISWKAVGIWYLHRNQSCDADQWKNHSQGFSTDCVFFYNSDYHFPDSRVI